MLYVTTRNHRDSYTAQRALTEQRGPDGGLYIPFRVEPFSQSEIESMAALTFNQRLAMMLNYLFQTRLSAQELDFALGRYPVRLVPMSHRILIGECWHSSGREFQRMARSISGIIRRDTSPSAQPGQWLETGARIAILFGVYGELLRSDIMGSDKRMDISVVSGDFSAPMSAWYARAWGLPIGNIVCCCNENSAVWDLIYHGQLRTDGISVPTATPKADVTLPEGLECLISSACGETEALRFVDCLRTGKVYVPQEASLRRFREGIQVSVVSGERTMATIPSVYATSAYLLSPYAALAYAGLLDYRVRTGETRCALVLAERNPLCDAVTVANAMNGTVAELQELLTKQ